MNIRTTYGLLLITIALIGCAASVPPAVGMWDVELNTPLGAQQVVLTIDTDGTGSFAGPQGEQGIEGIMFDGNGLTFSLAFDAQGQSVTLDFSGSIEGNALNGEFNTPFGSLAVSGSRQ
tara:strand:- start:30281 stop:30637 length:357 start_codon:yes stop_codon:yes gene_type:complete